MVPWIQVYSNLSTHRKTSILIDELGLGSASVSPEAEATGILVSLWTWAVQNACDGDLSACSDRAISSACGYKKSPAKLVSALLKSGYLDRDRKLHDWDEHTMLIQASEENRKKKTRDRVIRYRESKKALQDIECNATHTECNAQPVTQCNADCNVTDTLHSVTVTHLHNHNHNITEHNSSTEDRKKELLSTSEEGPEVPPDEPAVAPVLIREEDFMDLPFWVPSISDTIDYFAEMGYSDQMAGSWLIILKVCKGKNLKGTPVTPDNWRDLAWEYANPGPPF